MAGKGSWHNHGCAADSTWQICAQNQSHHAKSNWGQGGSKGGGLWVRCSWLPQCHTSAWPTQRQTGSAVPPWKPGLMGIPFYILCPPMLHHCSEHLLSNISRRKPTVTTCSPVNLPTGCPVQKANQELGRG